MPLDLRGAFSSGLERLALLDEREPAARSVAARRGPLGPEPGPLWAAMLRGEIMERGYWRARSAEVGAALGRPGWVLKPDPRAYAMAAEALGLPPSAIVFVDDMPWNAAPARRA